MADNPAGVRAGKAGGPHGLRVLSPADPGYVEWCRAHRVLPSCSRCGAPRRKGSPDGLCGRCRQLLSGKART